MTGLVLLDKREGLSSFAAAAALRRVYGERRIGHTGTLDPMASGVLPVLLGRATRLSPYLLDADKRYSAVMRLGVRTDTLDITGKVLSVEKPRVSDEDLRDALRAFSGEIMQTPPMYSAIKIKGRRLYSLAREGVEVERSSRKINIKSISLISRDGDDCLIDVVCSKGTYIRSLAADIGDRLGCGAALAALRRTATGGFSIDDCADIESISADPAAFILPAERAVPHLPRVSVTRAQAARFMNGGGLFLDRLEGDPLRGGDRVRCFFEDVFLGLGEVDEENGLLKVDCVICEELR